MTRGIVVDPVSDREEELNRQAPEHQEPGQPEHDPSNDLPEKLRGKSPEELAEMYVNLESELGRLRNEVGYVRQEASTWRSLAEELGTAQRQTQPERKPVEISGDELLTKPKDAIRAVLDEVLDERLGPVVQDVQRTRKETEAERFVRDYPNYLEVANSEDFQKWVTGNQRRLSLVQKALQNEDIAAMRTLMEDWTERQALVEQFTAQQQQQAPAQDKPAAAPTGLEGARKVATERPGQGGGAVGKKVFHEHDVINTMLTNPDKYYSEAYQQELLAAMREGRYKK